MKKMLMILAVVAMAATTAMAGETSTANEAHAVSSVNYHFRVHITDMRRAMDLTENQIPEIQKITRELSRRIAGLENIEEGEDRRAMLTAIMSRNLNDIRKVVTGTQYHAYLSLLNSEFNKAGLNTILYGYEIAMN